jgi:hypothetical protein
MQHWTMEAAHAGLYHHISISSSSGELSNSGAEIESSHAAADATARSGNLAPEAREQPVSV